MNPQSERGAIIVSRTCDDPGVTTCRVTMQANEIAPIQCQHGPAIYGHKFQDFIVRYLLIRTACLK